MTRPLEEITNDPRELESAVRGQLDALIRASSLSDTDVQVIVLKGLLSALHAYAEQSHMWFVREVERGG